MFILNVLILIILYNDSLQNHTNQSNQTNQNKYINPIIFSLQKDSNKEKQINLQNNLNKNQRILPITQPKKKKRNHFDITNIYGNSTTLNYYYINVYIGNPPKEQSLIINTGSSHTGIPCKEYCDINSCGKHLNSYYSIKGM